MKLKSRRGNVAVLLAILLSGFIAVSAMSIDVTRVGSLRNELQFSADAGAHAGAIQLMEPNDPTLTVASATAYAKRYLVSEGTVDVDSVELGGWDDVSHNFQPGLTPINAVRVVVSRRSPGLLVPHLGPNSPRVRASAVGWIQSDSQSVRRIILAQ